MAIVDPTTRSPGVLRVHYLGPGLLEHSAGLRLDVDGYPASVVAAETMATDFATQLSHVFNVTTFTAFRWTLTDEDGATAASAGFTTPINGDSTDILGELGVVSASIAFLGRGLPSSLGVNAGRIKMTLFTGDTYPVPPHEGYLVVSAYPALLAFSSWLTEVSEGWADVWGQHGFVEPRVAVQYNAHVQRIRGA